MVFKFITMDQSMKECEIVMLRMDLDDTYMLMEICTKAIERMGIRMALDISIQLKAGSIKEAGWKGSNMDMERNCILMDHFIKEIIKMGKSTELDG